MKLPNPCFAILSPIMRDFPSEELRNEGKRFLWGGPTVPPFFVGDKRPVGLPDISRGMEIQQGTPPSFVSLFDPVTNTPFYSAYKVLPGQAKNIGTKPRPKNPKWMDPPGTYCYFLIFLRKATSVLQRISMVSREMKEQSGGFILP